MKTTLIVLTMGVLVAAQAALAEDLQPPPWRGNLSTTSQVWEFDYPQPNPIPPDGPAPGGQPPLQSTKLWVFPGPEPPWNQWIEEDQPIAISESDWVGFGVWPLSGSITVLVDNHDPKPENIKIVWVQITWRPQDLGEEPIFDYFQPSPAPGHEPRIVEEILLDPSNPLGWRETTYTWQLDWNPPDETFAFHGTINVDEIVVDTWCIPEPGTLVLLAGGAAALLARRRRR